MRVAFIGTGLMGHPMAERVLAAGHELIALQPHPREGRAAGAQGSADRRQRP